MFVFFACLAKTKVFVSLTDDTIVFITLFACDSIVSIVVKGLEFTIRSGTLKYLSLFQKCVLYQSVFINCILFSCKHLFDLIMDFNFFALMRRTMNCDLVVLNLSFNIFSETPSMKHVVAML